MWDKQKDTQHLHPPKNNLQMKLFHFQVEIIFKPHACLAPDVAARLGEAGTRFIKTKVIEFLLYKFLFSYHDIWPRSSHQTHSVSTMCIYFHSSQVEASIDHLSQYLVLRLGSDLGLVPDNISGDEVGCCWFYMHKKIWLNQDDF